MILENTKRKLQTLAGINPVYKLYVFDFDGTLVNSLMPDEGKEIWKQRTKKEYPHKGWWSKEESLNADVFDIKPIESTMVDYKKAIAEKNSLTVMLTSRIPKMKDAIMRILSENGLKFDDYMFKDSNKEKPERVEDILQKHPDINHIEIWDDRQKEIDIYATWKKKVQKNQEELPIEKKTKIIIHHV